MRKDKYQAPKDYVELLELWKTRMATAIHRWGVNNWDDVDDLLQGMMTKFIADKLLLKYDGSKGAFSTYFYASINYFMLAEVRKRRRRSVEIPYPSYVSSEGEIEAVEFPDESVDALFNEIEANDGIKRLSEYLHTKDEEAGRLFDALLDQAKNENKISLKKLKKRYDTTKMESIVNDINVIRWGESCGVRR